ncbi:hypothetical protein [Stakelama marina]|uniref:hypothetical protein n=1 Tax=Stakelama marina TaxID=2826939 RepID=UPI0024C3F1ED|nr:hypothetical protein [Stakelama marina]
MKSSIAFFIACTAILFVSIAARTGTPQQGIVDAIDHYRTGFPLEGGHERVPCESCHRNGVFKGTPRRCEDCHNNIRAEGKGFRHIPTSLGCEQCHSVQEWRLSRFDHTDITSGCFRCHNNFTAPGKTLTHPPTSNVCEDCHGTVHWPRLLPGVGASTSPRVPREHWRRTG